MQALTSDQLSQLVFENSLVKDMIVDANGQIFSLTVDRALIEQSDTPIEIHDVTLKVEGFDEVKARIYNDEEFVVVDASDQNHFLAELCEWTHETGHTMISGFSNLEGSWSDFTVKGGTFTVTHS